ncbi:hypothetical protein GWI33_015622 [Rhynchophorus ferrugineus]|uniref:MAGE domain-containing protein n=1 Tax=Rhynchophorus ferrugineus TaxID=354439 RepID=A0A834I432_RHYFE|nr:hypothetical protein GWI33_015622 [Rhynchophorus ferrugineus]
MWKKRRSVSGSQKTNSQTDPDVPDQNTENIINDVVSILPSANYSDEEEEECVSSYETGSNVPNAAHKILTLLILSHIFMSNTPVSDKSLYSFLKSLDIDVEVEHPFFGKVKEYIRETLIKNYYLHCEFDDKTKIQTFQWGIRAEIEISKMKVLQFVCEMYGNKQPKDWPEHYRAAENQFREREQKEETRVESS